MNKHNLILKIILPITFVTSLMLLQLFYLPQQIPQDNNNEEVETIIETITIGLELFTFNPNKVETLRPDLFKTGHFSMFDILVHLANQNKIELEYHFEESMNTHVIDSINGEQFWWYESYYSGGWPERNVFRMDHYPWKKGTFLQFYKSSQDKLDEFYAVFIEELDRKKINNNKLVIPKVIINGVSFSEEFENVEITPHNLRNDIFQENIPTAIDVIMSLSDQGEITYNLKWYERIGTADIVKSYWVETINQDTAYGRCGFVYEAGSYNYDFFKGNHIHLPSDVRILNSPEYVEFFWICL